MASGVIRLGRGKAPRSVASSGRPRLGCGSCAQDDIAGGLGFTFIRTMTRTLEPTYVSTETTETAETADEPAASGRTMPGVTYGEEPQVVSAPPLKFDVPAKSVQVSLGQGALSFTPAAPGTPRHATTLKPFLHLLPEGRKDIPWDVLFIPLTNRFLTNPDGTPTAALKQIAAGVRENIDCPSTRALPRSCSDKDNRGSPGGIPIFVDGLNDQCWHLPPQAAGGLVGWPALETLGRPSNRVEGFIRLDQRMFVDDDRRGGRRGVPILVTEVDEQSLGGKDAGLENASSKDWIVEVKFVSRTTRRTGVTRLGPCKDEIANGNVLDLSRNDIAVALIFRRRPSSTFEQLKRATSKVVSGVSGILGDLLCPALTNLVPKVNNLAQGVEKRAIELLVQKKTAGMLQGLGSFSFEASDIPVPKDEREKEAIEAEAKRIQSELNQGKSVGAIAGASLGEEIIADLKTDANVKALAKEQGISASVVAELGVQMSPAQFIRDAVESTVNKFCPPNTPLPPIQVPTVAMPDTEPPRRFRVGVAVGIGAGVVGGGVLLFRFLRR